MSSPLSARVRLVADPYPPYQYASAGTVEGLDQDLVIAAFAAAGIAAETELLGWEDCLTALRGGAADALFQITPTAERRQWLAFSAPFREARTLLYRRRGERPVELEGDLAATALGRRLGALAGFSYGAEIDAVAGKVELDSDAELLGALRRGVLDLAVVDEGVATHLLAGDAAIEPVPGFAQTRPLHLACLREREDVVRSFDRGRALIGAAP